MNRLLKILGWAAVALAGAGALAVIAIERHEPINAVWLVLAAVCTYLVAYRFYSSFLAVKVFALDDTRATPAERLEDGRDFVRTNKWVLLGHHFAAIAGPGPLVGPTLAAQFGYLPGTLWIVAGAVLGGCVQDFVILFCSIRRNGKTLGEMARDEVSRRGGRIAVVAVLAIMVILLAVVALVVVNALKSSPWATFTLAMSVPIALGMGIYLRYLRPGRVIEATVAGVALMIFAVVAGQWVNASAGWSRAFTLGAAPLAVALIVYGFAASVLPVWLLLAPRDYLSSFIKVGTILALAAGVLVVHPALEMPALTRFADGTGPIFSGKIFPFCFITIACGAVSGFHALISSGTTPKMIERESQARLIGYGSMIMESLVAVMAMVAACSLQPGVFFAINSPAGVVGHTAQAAAQTISAWGFPLHPATMQQLASEVGERTMLDRTGGAPSLAAGMAQIFSRAIGGGRLLAIWYHFAIMFEALFILTVLDAGTRVGRFMVQEAAGRLWAPLGRRAWYPGILIASALMVGAWGYFLYQGVLDPLGGINSLWPLFGIANQLLAAVALVVATTVLLKMGRRRWLWVTLGPGAALVAVTMTASYQKIFHPDPHIGFLAQANLLAAQLASGAVPAAQVEFTRRLIFNNRLDAVVTGLLAAMVLLLVVEAVGQWQGILTGRQPAVLHEAPYIASEWGRAEGD
ncbi:MAG TPA: carbon starvation CstA family protein [Candidatus Acidoferrales bacterium]|nr:carbon starvation CstA family protein [Candidatus Acidoferrales bacterium]